MSSVLKPPKAIIDRRRIAQLLAMFSSDHDGEVVNAARMAEKMRQAAGVTWADIVEPQQSGQPRRDTPVRNTADAIQLVLDNIWICTDWERRFIVSISSRQRLSAKQTAILQRLASMADQVRKWR